MKAFAARVRPFYLPRHKHPFRASPTRTHLPREAFLSADEFVWVLRKPFAPFPEQVWRAYKGASCSFPVQREAERTRLYVRLMATPAVKP